MTSNSIDNLGRHIKHAARSLRREPSLTLGIILTFALSIGATAAMFGLVNRLMLSAPPGISDPKHVATVALHLDVVGGPPVVMTTTSYPSFRAVRAATGAFDAVAAERADTVLVGREDAARVAALGVTGDYFAALGARPLLGRFPAGDETEATSGAPIVVLGHGYWLRAFNGDRAIVGRELIVNDQRYTIIGVAAAGFNGTGLSAIDLFVPLPTVMRGNISDWASNRFANVVSIVARLRQGVDTKAASEIATAALRDDASAGGKHRSPSVGLTSLVPGKASRSTPQGQITLWLAGVSIIVLLIATANVGTLLLLRAARRRRELAVRVALGAGRSALTAQMLVESVLLSLTGAAVGVLFSRWFATILRVKLLPTLAPGESFVDGAVLSASLFAACGAGLIAGLIPTTRIGRMSLIDDLRGGGEHGASRRLSFHNWLARAQVALCMTMLVGAALFVRSLERIQSQDLGLTTTNLLHVQLEFRGYVSGIDRDLAYLDAEAKARQLPGVTGTTPTAGVPFGPHNIPPVSYAGLQWPPTGQLPIMYAATPAYLELLGVKLVAGRLFDGSDRYNSPLVVLVNETMAKTAWPSASPLGQCVRVGFATFPPIGDGNPADGAVCRRVVGVVRDTRARSLRPENNEDRLMQYYVPFSQIPAPPMPDAPRTMGLLVRVRGDADVAAARVQRAIQSTSTIRLYAQVRPYQDFIDPQLRTWRLGATVFTAFGFLALAIAVVGVFAVVSYVVAQRMREMGVRLALGATPLELTTLIVRDSARLVGAGILVGTGLALAAGPLVASQLFQTSPREPMSLALAALVLGGVTIIASLWPAWRAGTVNPVKTLGADA
jgi:predicted permease